MYYFLVYRDKPGGKLYTSVYTQRGAAEADLRRHNTYGLVIAYEGVGNVRNYGLVEDMTDHIDEL